MSKVIALAGNPNVGKSTVFNALTGRKQHTGNWPGKTVEIATGEYKYGNTMYHLIDLPGCYSLLAHSQEEEIARDFICFENPDAVIAVCDATCLERNMNLVLQIMETGVSVVLCINLMDEAEKKQIDVNIKLLSKQLGIPVVGISARSGIGLEDLLKEIENMKQNRIQYSPLSFPSFIESAIQELIIPIERLEMEKINSRWMAIRLLEGSNSIVSSMNRYLGYSLYEKPDIAFVLSKMEKKFLHKGMNNEQIQDLISETYVKKSEWLCSKAVTFQNQQYARKDRKFDWIFTSKKTGIPIMFLLLFFVFWITISGANVPSEWLSEGLFWIEDRLLDLAVFLHMPESVYSPVIFGVYRVLAWVISVMLPPMAIFFPLFTLLEDFGYLPRVAFNLDRCFKKCCACGKQALTMCMGFGCNAVGVTGCRIIDSPRERMIAIITNSFVPCNGRFPTMIAILSMFFVFGSTGFVSSVLSAFFLALIVLFGIFITLIVSYILSKTILKGIPSSFTLELPPYRKPQIGKVIIRSVFDRTLFVVGRGIVIAAPAGLLIWSMANITIGDVSLLRYCTEFLDPFARWLGLDGVILMAFILGMPANEIVLPIILMTYLAQGSLLEISDLTVVKALLVDHGWTWVTAVCTILFSLMHWPCGTTCMTIKKETGSIRWVILSIFVPTIIGMGSCFLFAQITGLFMDIFS